MASFFDNIVEIAMKAQFDSVYGQPATRTPRGGTAELTPVQVILCRAEQRTPEAGFEGQVFDEAEDTLEVRRSEVAKVFRDDVFKLSDGQRWLVDRVKQSDGHHWLMVVTEL